MEKQIKPERALLNQDKLSAIGLAPAERSLASYEAHTFWLRPCRAVYLTRDQLPCPRNNDSHAPGRLHVPIIDKFDIGLGLQLVRGAVSFLWIACGSFPTRWPIPSLQMVYVCDLMVLSRFGLRRPLSPATNG